MTQQGSRRYGAVIKTYLDRTAFRVLGIATLIEMLAIALVVWIEQTFQPGPFREPWDSIVDFALMTMFLAPWVLFVMFGGMMMLHLREQLNASRIAATPGYLRPHLVVSFVALIGVPTVLMLIGYLVTIALAPSHERLPPPIGVFAALMALLAATVWLASIKSPWFCLLVLPLTLLAMTTRVFRDFLNLILNGHPNPAKPILASLSLLLVDVALITGLYYRLSFASQRDRQSSGRRRAPAKAAEVAVALRPHRVLSTPLSRAWHRRHGVLSPMAPWFVGASLGLILTIVAAVSAATADDIQRSVLLPTIIPGVIISLVWRERWMNLGYESLYPADRGQFVQELLTATAISLAELWVATALAVLPPILMRDPHLLATPIFVVTLIASAAMQFMVFGIMFLSALYRPMLPYVNVITILAQLIPISYAWMERPELSQRGLLAVAGIEMGIGVAITLLGYTSWRRADLA